MTCQIHPAALAHACPNCGHSFVPDPFPLGTRVKLKDTGGTWHGVIAAPKESLTTGTRLVVFDHAPSASGYEPGQHLAVPTMWLERA